MIWISIGISGYVDAVLASGAIGVGGVGDGIWSVPIATIMPRRMASSTCVLSATSSVAISGLARRGFSISLAPASGLRFSLGGPFGGGGQACPPPVSLAVSSRLGSGVWGQRGLARPPRWSGAGGQVCRRPPVAVRLGVRRCILRRTPTGSYTSWAGGWGWPAGASAQAERPLTAYVVRGQGHQGAVGGRTPYSGLTAYVAVGGGISGRAARYGGGR